MIVKDIFKDDSVKIFEIISEEDDNILNWKIKPTNLEIIPNDEGFYFVKAFDNNQSSYLSIVTPERVTEIVLRRGKVDEITIENIEIEHPCIPLVASESFGNYELYYLKENPKIGIEILKEALEKSLSKSSIAEDLGYIFRDEGKIDEAIKYFIISTENTPSS
ncbi:hypothetical protein [Chryseobacterium sp.]|uniref:tetratricopeptide repeat protein n=1 Tax=Chryseobacterium sp. TaxID=1871047 RepID=UPI002897DC01|nr:hypothetical protein [Chryseobacterium sp.]